ncbi:AAA family ATPase [Penicillium lagena]|uniref:AAA family ATPase n=1 Tax=Penicillium lagena TaxID=94218 RepID=UPI00254124FA|nr:AAA family ATPase [Penicillium lagena]KAJ5612627.1 AAA family ATPase [Penicillium lagena]
MRSSSKKRSLEEIINKSDSDDEDYDDHQPRSSGRAKSRSTSKKVKRSKKRQRRGSSDDDLLSDDDDLGGDSSFDDDEEDSDDPNIERNARGSKRRQTTQKQLVYAEPSSDDEDEAKDEDEDEDEDEEDADASPPQKKSKVISLKVPPEAFDNRRITRRHRGPSEDMYALTNSGHHMETIRRGTRSPETALPPRHGSRSNRAVKQLPLDGVYEESKVDQEEEAVEENVVEGSQPEIMESDPEAEAEKADAVMADDEGVVPESDTVEAKADEAEEEDEDDDEGPVVPRRLRRQSKQSAEAEDDAQVRRSGRKKPASQRKSKTEESDFEPDEEEEEEDEDAVSETGPSHGSPRKSHAEEEEDSSTSRRAGLRKRGSRSRGVSELPEAVELAEELEDLRGGRRRRRLPEIIHEKPRRNRKDVDYRLIRPDLLFPLEEAENEVNESPSRRGRGGGGSSWQRTLFPTYGPFGGAGSSAILGPPGAPAAAGGADSDSSDDEPVSHPKGPPGLASGGGIAPQGHSADAAQGASGTPANLGKMKDKQALADADPLGVDMNVNFDNVGGLQGHIDQLKEMVSLPLLYPEIFQRFHIVPPRGVLFHGPPGTGKTLLARALANSVSSEGRKVTFYMRKGADALSKWVGEAERQLRLLFEEARKTQPSIIFFDEIDGLAPVRSSKQEQIHASIVSTLLALMDGMDGRGQVIVIGATNRPDSVDPALRRPGRFDREFYFPLPNVEGRRAILDIHTKGWDPPLPDNIKDELAEISKGYGGADLRALCTEAALNAVQRRYPQIYKSDKKLVIDPKMIDVTPKDFMIAIKKMVPSSERSTASGASALPKNVEPLLRRPLLDIEALLSEILPQRKQLTALEEAHFEEPEDARGFKREQIMSEFDRSRVFRPRMLLRGAQGMGQQYLAAALLHHFEGLHVQAFDLPTLLSDSTRSPEATVIQLFAEVKRHKPSVIYIPNIQIWYETVGPAVMSTFMGLLRSVPPTDPVLLLGVLEVTGDDLLIDDERPAANQMEQSLLKTLPGPLKNLFGFSKKNIYDLAAPDNAARYEFFNNIIEYVKTPPADFPDPEKRKKRKLEELEVAPPPPPKAETPLTKEQMKAQKKKDRQTLNLLKIRIQPIMDQIKKYKRFRSGVIEESQIRYLWEEEDPNIVTSDLPPEEQAIHRPFEKAYDKHGVPGLREVATGKFFYNMEIVTMEKRLSNGYYKRPTDFLADIKRIAKDARQFHDQERLLRANELLSNVEVDISTIEQTEPALVSECENVYTRELAREKEAVERAKRVAEAEERLATAHFGTGNVPHGNTESAPSSGPVHLGEWLSGDAGRPVTPTRKSNVSFTNGYHQGGGSDLNDTVPHGGLSNGSHEDEDGDVFMANPEGNSGSKETQTSSFGPSAQPKPPYSYTAPSQQLRRESGLSSLPQDSPITPMAPGSQPADYTNEASTTQTTSDKKSSAQSSNQHHTQSFNAGQGMRHDGPDLSLYPDRVSQEEHLPDTQQGGSSQFSPPRQDAAHSENSVLNGSQSQSKPQPPLFDAPSKPESNGPADLQSLLNDEPSPTLIIDPSYVDSLHEQLAQRTSGCSVEQLEQISTNLMDYIWRMRGEWNRTLVATGITETFNAVLEDIQSLQEIGPISQKSKEQLWNAGFRV